MFRVIFYLLIAIFLITVIRAVVGIVLKGFAELLSPSGRRRAAGGSTNAEIPLSGELKRDPVCGTFTSTATALRKTVGKETVYFCSSQCRDKYVASH